MKVRSVDTSRILGWGVDADPENDPTYPMRNIEADDKGGMNWQRPSQQEPTVEILCSIERNNLSAVFGTSTPPRGLSGMIRRRAFRYSEAEWAHWLMLMAADRVNVVEGLVQDLGRGRIPNIPAEMGIRSEIEHNRTGLFKKVVIAGAVLTLAAAATHMLGSRRRNGSPNRSDAEGPTHRGAPPRPRLRQAR
jgi:hypothetical protein